MRNHTIKSWAKFGEFDSLARAREVGFPFFERHSYHGAQQQYTVLHVPLPEEVQEQTLRKVGGRSNPQHGSSKQRFSERFTYHTLKQNKSPLYRTDLKADCKI